MLTTLLDFFCSRPFPEPPPLRARLLVAAQALLWAVLAFALGALLTGGFAVPGENARALAAFTGAAPVSQAGWPMLRWLVRLTVGPEPSMLALNLFGAGVMGLTAAMTWLAVRFWVLDAMNDDSVLGARPWVSALTAHAVCVLFLLSLPGLYAVSGFTEGLWGFALLLVCVVLQNGYALGGGRRWSMVLFALVLGAAVVESSWALLFLPVFFLRAVAVEWRLWDHSVRNLPLWFLALVVGAVALLLGNTLRMDGGVTMATLWGTEREVLRGQLMILGAFVDGPWLLNVAFAAGWPLLAWLTARRLLNNDRVWGLLFTALVISLAGFGLFYGVRMTPMRVWFMAGVVPVATAWVVAVSCGMLAAGWGVQLFARNPNIYEEMDRRRIPVQVSAMRTAAIFLFPLSILAVVVTLTVHGRRFARVDRALADRFAGETVGALAKDSGSPAAGRSYVLGAAWIDPHLMLVAQARGVPLTLFSVSRAGDRAYVDDLRRRLEHDPLLGDADRLRLVHLLDYNFLVFVQDFFVSQPNADRIAAAYDLADVWYAAKLRPFPCGTLYLGIPEHTPPAVDPLPAQRALEARWAGVLKAETLPWWDLNVSAQRAIRHHLAFMANNLGTFLDDQGRLADAAACYLYASETASDNVSALLNLYDICVRRGQLPEQSVAVNRAFEDFLRARAKASRKYDLSAVGRYFGYIRNYDLFVQMGWDWAVSAAPESVLAGLRNAQSGFAPTDPRNGAMQAVVAAVYELQGQTERSVEGYRAAVAVNPRNVEALRGLARLSIQQGKVNEAGQWLSKAEEAGADQDALDIDRTAYLMALGDLEGATKAIGRFTAKNKDSAVGWAMLGMLEIEKGNLDRASGFILQNIKRTASKGRDLYFQHVLEGRLAQSAAQAAEKLSRDPVAVPSAAARKDAAKAAAERWEEARRQYRRAYAIRSNVRGLLELILDFDRRLEDKVAAEADALAILREDTRHPYANFIVGSQRLGDGHAEAAVKYFRVAIEGSESPTVDVVNNYADALSRTANLALAKEMGLRAIRLAPQSYATWGTYALVLARGGEAAKAQTALEKARSLEGGVDDPRLGYVEVWMALDAKDAPAAEKARARLREALGPRLTPLDVRDLKEIDDTLQGLRPGA